MRIYHFLPASYALDDLSKGRLKIAQFDDLNDPFELLSNKLSNPFNREVFRLWKEDMIRQFGVLCFSRSWENPILWSHYADKHKGICLGFDMRDDLLTKITYTGERLVLVLGHHLKRAI